MGTVAETPRRCGLSTPPTGSGLHALVAQARTKGGTASPSGAGPDVPKPAMVASVCTVAGCAGAAVAMTAVLSVDFVVSIPKSRCRWLRGEGPRAAMRSLRSSSVRCSSSTLAPRLSTVGSLRCLAQRTSNHCSFYEGDPWRKGSGAILQQAFQDGMVVRFDTETGIHRVAAVLVTQLFKARAVALLRSCKTPSNLSGPNPAVAPVRSRVAPALRHAPGPSVLAAAVGPA